MPPSIDVTTVHTVGAILNDVNKPLAERFRALFTLRNLGGKEAIDHIGQCFIDSSELLKHECAYCLGQMQDVYAIGILTNVLKNCQQEPIVRHEAAEALGAIGSKDVLNLLEEYCKDPVIEVSETCQLAVHRIRWLHSSEKERDRLSDNPYNSVDPAPPCANADIPSLRKQLLDENFSLFERYRAMFGLRNIGTDDAVLALAEGLKCKNALFRHEIAYVLGQTQNSVSAKQLTENLKKSDEHPMVRHECAEALGAIATDECMSVLREYLKDNERVVKESCEVALDMGEFEQSGQFQYADTLSKVSGESS